MIKRGNTIYELTPNYLINIFIFPLLSYLDDVKNSTQVKIYDFQLYFYQSFACDLIFFLFSSVRCDELAKYFKMFIYHYHLEFLKTMKMLKCPREDYTYDKWVF